jgi:molybdopterin biosynthesis enzyme
MGEANCFICLEAETTGAQCGEMVNIILFDTLPGL